MLLIASLHPAATIARIDGRWSSLLPSCSKTGGENERLGACAYRGSRRCLRHSISVAGPKIPSTKAVKGRSLSPADKRHHIQLADVQAIFFRRRHQARRPPNASAMPGAPAPTIGPGTGASIFNMPSRRAPSMLLSPTTLIWSIFRP